MRGLFLPIRFFSVLLIMGISAGCEVPEQTPPGSGFESNQPPPFEKISLLSASYDEVADYVAECGKGKKLKLCVLICHVPPGNTEAQKTKYLPLKASLHHLLHGTGNGQGNHHHFDYIGYCDDDPNAPVDNESDEDSNEDGSDDGTDGNEESDDSDENSDNDSDDHDCDDHDDDSTDGSDGSDDSDGTDGTNDESDDSTDGTDDTNDGTDSSDGSGGSSDEEPPIIPDWCVEIFDLDNNCDGIDDETGEPLF